MPLEHFDVLIGGAGLSGASAGCHLQDKCPGRTFAILEARESIGGTWDLFRYPGIRSDSDMYTLGFKFRPWPDAKTIADGPPSSATSGKPPPSMACNAGSGSTIAWSAPTGRRRTPAGRSKWSAATRTRRCA